MYPPHQPHLGERRAVTRRTCNASSCRLFTADGDVRPAKVWDISRGGVGLLCHTPLSPGESLGVELSGPGSRITFALEARVVHAEARPDGRWTLGCAFAQNIPASLVALIQ